ncbi:hypothetical protein Hypma_001685, partial [Hypsizygus marmoreus]
MIGVRLLCQVHKFGRLEWKHDKPGTYLTLSGEGRYGPQHCFASSFPLYQPATVLYFPDVNSTHHQNRETTDDYLGLAYRCRASCPRGYKPQRNPSDTFEDPVSCEHYKPIFVAVVAAPPIIIGCVTAVSSGDPSWTLNGQVTISSEHNVVPALRRITELFSVFGL